MDCVILAAGKGTRMKSEVPKVLHEIGGSSLLEHLLKSLAPLELNKTVVVVGYRADQVKSALSNSNLDFALQEEQKGTAHALQQARTELESDRFLVFPGDLPLIKTSSIRQFIETTEVSNTNYSLSTTERDDPSGYGRIKRDEAGRVKEIVEEQDATREEKEIKEVNTGVYLLANTDELWAEIDSIDTENAQNEFYLTDLVQRFSSEGKGMKAITSNAPEEFLGVNTRQELAQAGEIIQDRKTKSVMEGGVTIIDPGKTIIEPAVTVGRDTVIRPFTTLKGETEIGNCAEIGPNAEIINGKIGDEAVVSHAVVRDSKVNDGEKVEPFQRIGPETGAGEK